MDIMSKLRKTIGLKIRMFGEMLKSRGHVRFLPFGREGRGLVSYLYNGFKRLPSFSMAAKPLPATSQPAAPLPMGGRFGGNNHISNIEGLLSKATYNLLHEKSLVIHPHTNLYKILFPTKKQIAQPG
jgi:hypothetical protein